MQFSCKNLFLRAVLYGVIFAAIFAAILFYMNYRGIAISDGIYATGVLIVPFLLGLLLSLLVSHSIKDDIGDIFYAIENITSMNNVNDFGNDLMQKKFYNQELSDLHYGIEKLLLKIQEMTVDKNIFEFEISLLEKFIITSDLVLNWKNSIFYILKEFNKVVRVYNIFTVFVQNSILEVNVFWQEMPSDEIKELFDKLIKESIIDSDDDFKKYAGNIEGLVITHEASICDANLYTVPAKDILPALAGKNGGEAISLQSKKIMLNAPQINGIVGVGVQSDNRGAARMLVVNGILTSLINVIGSTKAIYKYTKDLEFYATRDGLTKLYNQRVFHEFLSNAVHRARRNNGIFAFVVLDLDNFKLINDTYGHKTGDRILQGVAGILSENKRGEDVLARYGGDEFVMILQDATEEDAYRIMDRIRQKILSLNTEDSFFNKNIHITASIGISMFPKSASNEEDLFMLADNMMYKAKTSGKNAIHIFNENDLVSALKEKNDKKNIIMNALQNDLVLPYFQPIISLAGGNVKNEGECFNELLMRISIDGKIITAGEFIETAEDMGVAYKLDLLLVEKAFKKIRDENYKGFIFINLSPKSVIISDYVNSVKILALKYSVNPSKIVFERTERETVKNITLLEKFVSNLKFEGFQFAIDDFGSGYNSFLYVKYLPVDFIKIDGEFSRGAITDKMDRAVIMSLVTIAKELKIKTIAEYVESLEIMEAVKELGVDFGQGFYLGRPSGNLSVS